MEDGVTLFAGAVALSFTAGSSYDSGNAQSGFYRWDAWGIRFYTGAEALAGFIAQLKDELALR